jgi:uncharacterized protein (TIGR02996 family)
MDDEAFIRAIEAQPNDDDLRLVYADWLDEHNDPRGEFLRVEHQLATTSFQNAQRQTLGNRWLGMRTSLIREWIQRIGSNNMLPTWAKKLAGKPQSLGVRDFDHWMRQMDPQWIMLAVLAPIEKVVEMFFEIRKIPVPNNGRSSPLWSIKVPICSRQEGDYLATSKPIVQIRESGWTVAFYNLLSFSISSYYSAQEDARLLSEKLATLALEFSHEDTSSTTGYMLFECGDLVEFANWSGGDGNFASKKRPAIPWTTFPGDYPEELFSELGLYIPCCYARNDEDHACLVIEDWANPQIERADVVVFNPSIMEESSAIQQQRQAFETIHQIVDEREWEDIEDHHELEDDVPF